MLFKTTAVLSTLALLFAGQALGSPEANGALIATDPSEYSPPPPVSETPKNLE